MKKYIGTKEVLAQNMTATEAVEKGYKVNNHEGDGYEIEYEDGYKSWTPKELFDKTYKCIENPIDRIRVEKDELSIRYRRIGKFINSPLFENIDDRSQALLKLQHGTMRKYLQILIVRLGIMNENK